MIADTFNQNEPKPATVEEWLAADPLSRRVSTRHNMRTHAVAVYLHDSARNFGSESHRTTIREALSVAFERLVHTCWPEHAPGLTAQEWAARCTAEARPRRYPEPRSPVAERNARMTSGAVRVECQHPRVRCHAGVAMCKVCGLLGEATPRPVGHSVRWFSDADMRGFLR